MIKAEIIKYSASQALAKRTMAYLKEIVREGMTEEEIVQLAERYMQDNAHGNLTFWYHGKGALVLIGKRTVESVSGRSYVPSCVELERDDFLTVDLSPSVDGYWGDYARSLIVRNGKVCTGSFEGYPYVHELIDGMCTVQMHHKWIARTAKPEMTFGELYEFVNTRLILPKHYVNLDFRGNIGHTIEKRLEDRVFIVPGSSEKLADHPIFTIEPHIKQVRGTLGFKCEDVYCLQDGVFSRL